MPLLFLITYLLTSTVFDVSYTLSALEDPYMIPIMYIFILFLGGPLAEEIGWRGYALPELMKSLSPMIAAIIIGLIWSFWHLPAFFIPGSSQAPLPFLPYLFNTTLLSIIITILYIKSNNRISSALYFHASANFAVGIFYIIEEIEGVIVYLILILSVLGFLVFTNKKALFKSPNSNKQ
ncbi:MAG: CPBP family intramembrane metalloprotease [Candidatus Izimaplasma sp.]|nr:CPBP family intramembrane metalloprotease [Candidatus Izimaplasma bacterium]